MSRRPGNLDLSNMNKAQAADLNSPRQRFQLDLPSPKVGEIPPALSPLDAFAQHSRMLAKKFEESQQRGRRLSRLDALEVANEIGRRPTYFRSSSGQSQQADVEDEDDALPPLPNLPVRHQTPATDRPVSHYPMLGTADEDDNRNTVASDLDHDAPEPQNKTEGYFGFQVPRADSPEPYEGKLSRQGDASPVVPSLSGSVDSAFSSQPRTNTDDSTRPQRFEKGLIPPTSPPRLGGKSSNLSIRSVMDAADDDLLPPRHFSETSDMSGARSPFTPDPQMMDSRSPSIMSDRSAFHDDFHRPSFNFSRPISGSGAKDFGSYRPTMSQQHSFESRPSHDICRERSPLRQPSNSSSRSAASVRHRQERQRRGHDASSQSGDESHADPKQDPNGTQSYIYTKYALPRGRPLDRDSIGARTSWIQGQFRWEDGADDPQAAADLSPIVPETGFSRPIKQAVSSPAARSQSAYGLATPTPRSPKHRSSPSSPSVHSQSTDKTVRPPSNHTKNSPSQEIANLTAEQHLEKGIECHSAGSLNKSTYHLRHAAKAGHPTGMLLYALACRHGWGMRANQAEGVAWLKRAVDSSGVDIIESTTPTADAEAGARPAAAAAAAAAESPEARKAARDRKAQYALAIYELGMSYMNGWGTAKDKALAVRCFEIAGSWGDCDALAEAGFCYTQGLGVRKDLKRAAAFYRRAAEGGMSMAGNSWIYKPKYMDDDNNSNNNNNNNAPARLSKDGPKSPSLRETGDNKGAKGRSRARSIFGRKKSFINS